MIVQHNLQAMNSNRMLGVSTRKESKSVEKLTSGYKINRSADDAARLSMSEKMRKRIRGLTQAGSNVEDGISAVQVAEGALVEVLDMLQRMDEVAIEAANGINSESDRSYMQMEIDQLTQEIDRISESTKFNRTYLLNGAARNEKDYRFSYEMGAVTKAAEVEMSVGASTGIGANVTFHKDIATSEQNDLARAMASQGVSVMTYEGFGGKVAYSLELNGSEAKSKYIVSSVDNANKFQITNMSGFVVADIELTHDKSMELQGGLCENLTACIISAAESEKELYSLYDVNGNAISENALGKYFDGITDAGGNTDVRVASGASEAYDALGRKVELLNINKGAKNRIGVSRDQTNALKVSFHVGADGTSTNRIDVNIQAINSKSLGVNGLKVEGNNGANAAKAVDVINAAIEKIASQRAILGATQNRLEYTSKNLGNIVENTTASESRLRDADMAKEMVSYSNANILCQAGQSMLSQSNQSNEGVLALLG